MLSDLFRESPGGKTSSTRTAGMSVIGLASAHVAQTGVLTWMHVVLIGIAITGIVVKGLVQHLGRPAEALPCKGACTDEKKD